MSRWPSQDATFAQRFYARCEVDPASGCHNWTGSLNSKGYGRLMVDNVRRAAHRVAFQLAGGTIPDGLQIDHLCRNRRCVNPAHLEPVTNRENCLRVPPHLRGRPHRKAERGGR